MSNSNFAKTIEIVKTPHGDAPEWVRRAWIGCQFPVAARECGHVAQYVHSVMPQPRRGLLKATDYLAMSEEERNKLAPQKVAGYSVRQDVALKALAEISPAAHIFWKSLGFPKGGEDENCFRFETEACRVVEFYSHEELARPAP